MHTSWRTRLHTFLLLTRTPRHSRARVAHSCQMHCISATTLCLSGQIGGFHGASTARRRGISPGRCSSRSSTRGRLARTAARRSRRHPTAHGERRPRGRLCGTTPEQHGKALARWAQVEACSWPRCAPSRRVLPTCCAPARNPDRGRLVQRYMAVSMARMRTRRASGPTNPHATFNSVCWARRSSDGGNDRIIPPES